MEDEILSKEWLLKSLLACINADTGEAEYGCQNCIMEGEVDCHKKLMEEAAKYLEAN